MRILAYYPFMGLLIGIVLFFLCMVAQLIVTKLILPEKRDKFE